MADWQWKKGAWLFKKVSLLKEEQECKKTKITGFNVHLQGR